VTRYLLDTNIISESAKPQPTPAIMDWLQVQRAADLFITTLTVAEIWRGILGLRSGRRRTALEAWFAGAEGPRALFRNRILAFDEPAALEWGRVMAAGNAIGRPRSPIDMIIAATAITHGCIVVTANERHFRGVVEFLNPAADQPAAPGRGPV
jgi:predicted nucleic acid-binding protein